MFQGSHQYGRETDRDHLRNADLGGAWTCECVALFIYLFIFYERAALGGGALPDFFFSVLFPCSADHERDWPPCKVVFFGLGTNALNVRNNNNNNNNHCVPRWSALAGFCSTGELTCCEALIMSSTSCLCLIKFIFHV